MDRRQRRIAVLAEVLTMLILLGALFATLAHGQEKVICPQEFDPDDSAWVLIGAISDEEYFSMDRYFLYQPEAALRMRGEFMEHCKGILFSFLVGGREQPTWKVLYDDEAKAEKHFLRYKEGEWVSGTTVTHTKAEFLVPGGKLGLHLFQGDKLIAVVIVPVPKEYDWKAVKDAKKKREKEEEEK